MDSQSGLLFPGLTRRSVLGTSLASGALVLTSPAWAQVKGLQLLAPTAPGGGFDQLARAIQGVLQEEKLATDVQVVNAPGGGGTVGLAQFITTKKRSPSLMVIGLAVVSGVLTTKSPVTLQQTTPLARLIGEQSLIIVPGSSELRTMADLAAKLKTAPGEVSWAGGSTGGVDHVLVGLVGKALGVDPTKINFVAYAGGGEVLTSVLGGHTTVAVTGYNECVDQIRSGGVRALAVSGNERLPDLDVPTLKEAGVDVALINWRGVVGPADIRPADKEALGEMIAAMVKSPAWQEALRKRSWLDFYQPAEAFAPFLSEQQAEIEAVLKNVGLVQ